MKVRFSVNEMGELVSRDGRKLGRIAAMTLDLPEEEGGTIGGVEEPGSVSSEQQKTPPTPQNDDDVREVWDHYTSVISSRYRLDDKRRKIIKDALRVRSVAECKRAIDGLAASPHHNGQNDQRKTYLDLRYALKGIGAESNDERIDKMAALAPRSQEQRARTGADRATSRFEALKRGWEHQRQLDTWPRMRQSLVEGINALGYAVVFDSDGKPARLEEKS